MFERLVIPFIEEQCEKLDHVIYHWDGPGEIPHLDLLLAVKKLHGIQWVPGAGNPQPEDEKWFPLYARIQKAGKRLVLNCSGVGADGVVERKILNVFKSLDSAGLLVSTWTATREDGMRLAKAIGVPAD
jgi:5-methyltetrahydrofolate--homocysteine methyltransferase